MDVLLDVFCKVRSPTFHKRNLTNLEGLEEVDTEKNNNNLTNKHHLHVISNKII